MTACIIYFTAFMLIKTFAFKLPLNDHLRNNNVLVICAWTS